jgi:hypothetical protein
MKFASPLLLVLLAALPPAARAEDPTKVTPNQQNTQLAPGADNSDTRLAPGNTDNQLPFKRDERVQNNRFTTPELREKQPAPVGDRRAPIDVTETREKTIIDRKDYPKPEVRDNKMSPDNAQMFRTQPTGDSIKKYDMVGKYQNRMTDAANAAAQRQPKLEKRTTFDKINRFVFRRNGPGEDGNSLVTKAGGGPSAAVSGGAKKTMDVPPPPQLQPASAPVK